MSLRSKGGTLESDGTSGVLAASAAVANRCVFGEVQAEGTGFSAVGVGITLATQTGLSAINRWSNASVVFADVVTTAMVVLGAFGWRDWVGHVDTVVLTFRMDRLPTGPSVTIDVHDVPTLRFDIVAFFVDEDATATQCCKKKTHTDWMKQEAPHIKNPPSHSA